MALTVGPPHEPLPLGGRQPDPQVLGDLARNLLLNGEDLGRPAAELRAPELRAVDDVDQLGANHQAVVALQHAPGENGPNAEVLTDPPADPSHGPCSGTRCSAPSP